MALAFQMNSLYSKFNQTDEYLTRLGVEVLTLLLLLLESLIQTINIQDIFYNETQKIATTTMNYITNTKTTN